MLRADTQHIKDIYITRKNQMGENSTVCCCYVSVSVFISVHNDYVPIRLLYNAFYVTTRRASMK